jgi:acyl-CoA synthetase (NDP forming)/GNAT superfamily N-acetyltransferase
MKDLKLLLNPGSVAVIGASSRAAALGHRVVANLHGGNFPGPVLPVHPRHAAVQRIHCYQSVADLPLVPDLTIICTPAAKVADQLRQLGAHGGRAALVMSLDPDGSAGGSAMRVELNAIAAEFGMRWLGPQSAGLQLPRLGLNASWIEAMPPSGKLALVAQSAALAAGAVTWAAARQIGFSSIVALGDGGNVDVADLLDYLAADAKTQAILLCLHKIDDGSRFMASARAVARIKPVVVLWADSPSAGNMSTAPIVDHNFVFKAAARRAGLMRVDEIGEWFDAVETLGYGRRYVGEKLGIISNGLVPALLAHRILTERHPLLPFSDELRAELAAILPKGINPGNPLDLGVDAGAARFEAAMSCVLRNGAIDALLVIVSPGMSAMGEEIARAVAKVAKSSGRYILTCWLGGSADSKIHTILAAAEISVFESPETAVRAYLHLLRFRRSQEALKHLPEPCSFKSSSEAHDLRLSDEAESAEYLRAYGAISAAIMSDTTLLDGVEAKSVLAAVGLRGDLTASDNASQQIPLAIRVGNDPAFGRAIEASVGSRRWTLLPALNTELALGPAADLRDELRLIGFDMVPTTDLAAVLFRVADLLVGFPEIIGLEIPRFRWDGVSLGPCDARVWVREFVRGQTHLAIHPYPRETEERIELRDGRTAVIRPVRPAEDIMLLEDLLSHVADDDKYLRFCKVVKGVPPELLAKMLRVDYDRDMAFVALVADAEGQPMAIGMVDAFVSPDHREAEFSILLRTNTKGSGLGKILMQKVIHYCRTRHISTVVGLVLKENSAMRGLATRLGFKTIVDPDDDMVTVALQLSSKGAASA